MPASPELIAKFAQLKQARSELKTAIKAKDKALVATKYAEKKALAAEFKTMRQAK